MRLLKLLLLALFAVGFLLCGLVLWLNIFGLPGFAQKKIASALQDQGIAFQAREIRLAGLKKLLLRDVRISGEDASPEVTAPEAGLEVSLLNLLRGRVDLENVRITNALVTIRAQGTGEPKVILEQAEASLSLNEFGNLSIQRAHGKLFGIAVQGSGTIYHARDLFTSQPGPVAPGDRIDWRETLETINTALRQIEAPELPALDLKFKADTRRPELVDADLTFHARQATSPWGRLSEASILFSLRPATNGAALLASGSIQVKELSSTWAAVESARYDIAMLWPMATNILFAGNGQLVLTNLFTPWAAVPGVQMSYTSEQQTNTPSFLTHIQAQAQEFEFASTKIAGGALNLSLSHEDPLRLGVGFGELSLATNVAGEWRLGLTNLSRPDLTAAHMEASGTVTNSPTTLSTRGWGPWKGIADWAANFKADFIDLQSKGVVLGNLNCTGAWKAPFLKLAEARAELYGGNAGFSADLDVSQPALSGRFDAQYNYHKTAPILDKPAQKWLEQFSWETPPKISAQAAFLLPGWTNSWADLRKIVLDSILLKGRVDGQGAFRGIPVDHIQSDFAFANYIWRLPNLEIHRPEGHASIDYQANDRTQDFRAYINSHVDPHAILPLFDPEQQQAIKMVRFPTPPEIEGELTGNWRHDEQLSFQGKVRAQNFLIKKEPFLDLEARLSYSNLVVDVKDILGHRVPGEEVRAPEVRVDITNKVMHVRDVVSTVNPYIAMKLIGPVVYEAIEPYQFATPPLVRVNGVVPLSEPPDAADLRFEVTGTDFTFWRFRSPEVTGLVHWKDDDLTITNVHAAFYNGELLWSGHFHFNDDDTADYSFQASLRQADAKLLLNDVVEGKNKMEGIVDGTLEITSANSEDWKSWNGFGNATLRDGFLWDIPVFGMFTPMLEAISPGLGISKISSGSASFTITNSVISTRDLQVRAPAFRLRYEGEVDFDGKLQAKMEAQLLRDTWLVGKVLSTTLWPVSKVFQANITGTLEEPQSSLRHFPGFITAPFKPVFTLRNLLRGQRPAKPESTEAPVKQTE